MKENLAAIRRALEDVGIVFESDGKFVGVKLKIRRGKIGRNCKWMTR